MTDCNLQQTLQHVIGAIDAAADNQEPFRHLQLENVFPSELYGAMLDTMPAPEDYRQMSGRTKYTRTGDGGGTRTKLDLFPEAIGRLPREKRRVWAVVGAVLRAPRVAEAFRRRLATGLEKRLGPSFRNARMFAAPILLRDVPGYSIGIHPDTRWKGITVQLYLPRDRSTAHIGTVFHRRNGAAGFERVAQMPFVPNSGYAFAVGSETYHSVDSLGPEVRTRDSIILTYYLDDTLVQVLSNRGKRVGNFLRGGLRGLGLRPAARA
jgi:hypothetical protein